MVAGAAVIVGPDFSKITEQTDAAAGVVLGKMGHLVDLPPRHVAGLRLGDVVEKLDQFHDIAAGEQQQAVGGQTIAACTTGFLIVALDVFGQIRMNDVADVGFVDAHAEGDGGTDDLRLIAKEGVLVASALRRIEAGVVGDGGKSLSPQGGGECLGAFAGLAVDDPRVIAAGIGKVAHLSGHSRLSDDLVF